MLCLAALSCPALCNAMDCSTPGSSVHGDSPGKNTRVGCHILLQEIFPTNGSNPGLLHFRQILYRLSHQGSPRILRWVDYPFSRGIYQPRNQTRASCIAGGFLTNWDTREAPLHVLPDLKTNPGYHSNMMLWGNMTPGQVWGIGKVKPFQAILVIREQTQTVISKKTFQRSLTLTSLQTAAPPTPSFPILVHCLLLLAGPSWTFP